MRKIDRWIATLDQLLELVVLVNDDMERSLASDGLTTSRARLLWVLLHEGPSTQRVLAEALSVSARNVTGLVDGLVATGFVTREPHPTDRRATLVSFTEHGAAIARKMQEGQHEFAELLFAGMSRDHFDGFAEGLGEVLSRLRTRLGVTTWEGRG
jgi:DNA-binding MarR family transcriptional regulator